MACFPRKESTNPKKKKFCDLWAELFFCYGRPYCTDSYSLYSHTDLTWKSRRIRARISRQILDSCSLFPGRMEQSVQLTVGTENEVQKRPYSNTDLARFLRQNLFGLFWCCEVFSLARNVYLLLFCNFLKLNKNISLSHCVSPHWGFPWHLPKFLCYGLLSTVLFPLLFCLAMCISAYGNF